MHKSLHVGRSSTGSVAIANSPQNYYNNKVYLSLFPSESASWSHAFVMTPLCMSPEIVWRKKPQPAWRTRFKRNWAAERLIRARHRLLIGPPVLEIGFSNLIASSSHHGSNSDRKPLLELEQLQKNKGEEICLTVWDSRRIRYIRVKWRIVIDTGW